MYAFLFLFHVNLGGRRCTDFFFVCVLSSFPLYIKVHFCSLYFFFFFFYQIVFFFSIYFHFLCSSFVLPSQSSFSRHHFSLRSNLLYPLLSLIPLLTLSPPPPMHFTRRLAQEIVINSSPKHTVRVGRFDKGHNLHRRRQSPRRRAMMSAKPSSPRLTLR